MPGYGCAYGRFFSQQSFLGTIGEYSITAQIMLKIQLINSVFPPIFLPYASSFSLAGNNILQVHHIVLLAVGLILQSS